MERLTSNLKLIKFILTNVISLVYELSLILKGEISSIFRQEISF